MKEPEKRCTISASTYFRQDEGAKVVTETIIACGSCPYNMAFSTFREEQEIEDAEEIIREETARQQQECNLFVEKKPRSFRQLLGLRRG